MLSYNYIEANHIYELIISLNIYKGNNVAVLLVDNMRKRCREELTPIPRIYEQERNKFMSLDKADRAETATYMRLFNGVQSQLYRQRQKLVPALPSTAPLIELDERWTTTQIGDQFPICVLLYVNDYYLLVC